ncbi:MAG: hypothetical protein HQL76_06325 [Magnetococcales bacterium]|nr:hypothetical protein [Magnetococcales bacterium]
MAISSSSIAEVAIATERPPVMAVAVQAWSEQRYGNLTTGTQNAQSYGMFAITAASEQRYGNLMAGTQNAQSYGMFAITAASEQRYDHCFLPRIAHLQRYGGLMSEAQGAFPYGNGPVQGQHDQPITFTLDIAFSQGWTLMAVMRAQCAQPWTSTTSVMMQGTFRYDLLARNPVLASSRQIWNLSDDRSVRRAGNVIRAFHFGELI